MSAAMDTENINPNSNPNQNDGVKDIDVQEEHQEIDYEDDDPGYQTHDYESSSYQDSIASYAFSIDECLYENGRRYHKYFGTDRNLHPIDETEHERLDLHHEIFVLLLDGELYKAPLDPLKQTKILDIGTGTGVWAFEIACKFPDAEIIATDLSPVARFPWGALANCRFEVDDVEREWLYEDNSFSFIHMRNVSIIDWDYLMGQMFRTTQPGGWVEISDLGGVCYSDNGTLTVDQGASTYIETLSDALARAGRPFQTGASLKGHLEKAGFVNVQVFRYKQPWGPWPSQKTLKQAGALFLMQADTGFEAYALAPLTRILGMGHAEAMQICKGGIMASKNKHAHVYNY
ncbi:S-adenosyl-L-methionine-dependent methyltransferase [Pyronema omphalodes]|nr:S-adenosyl-L-methionine-dependent methyltransferase [Pyronema omphalodes]